MLHTIGMSLSSRNRPERFARMYNSAISLADDPNSVYFALKIDTDDPNQNEYRSALRSTDTLIISDRSDSLCKMVNEAYSQIADKYDIYGGCSDDIIFRTPHWDTIVRKALNSVPYSIGMLWGDGGAGQPKRSFEYMILNPNIWANMVALPAWHFLTKRWLSVLNYILPEYFYKDYADTWFVHIIAHLESRGLGAHVPYMEDSLKIEHMHPAFGKAVKDWTYLETEQHYFSTGHFNADKLAFENSYEKREEDSKKLVNRIAEFTKL